MSFKEYLENMTTSAHGDDSLPKRLKLAGVKAASVRKAAMVATLDAFYSNEQNIINTWNRLNSYEKEIMEEYIRSGQCLDSRDVAVIMKKHGRDKERQKYYSYSFGFTNIFNEDSLARLFFFNRSIPSPLLLILQRFVKPIEMKFKTLTKLPYEDIRVELIIRESFENDFLNIIRLVNSIKIKTTKGSIFPTKVSVLKINEVLVNKEIITEDYGSIEDIRKIEQTNRIYGIIKLLFEYEIMIEQDDILQLGPKANEFLKLNHVGKSRELLHAYIASSRIYEIDRIREIKVRIYSQAYYKTCRELILKYLSICPIDGWIAMEEFKTLIKKNDRQFLQSQIGGMDSYDDYHRYYTPRTQDWEELEGRYIDIVFIEYLSVLGIVDLALYESSDDYGSVNYFTVGYFKLTPLGAYIIGVTEDYEFEEQNTDSGFIVQPNYEIVVSEGGMKELHNVFFGRFAEKVSEDRVVVYKLTFKGIVNALDNGISVEEIIEYLKKYSEKSIPENVLMTLQGWERDSKRIRIRTVTIVETDNIYLMEELKSYKAIGSNMLNDLPFVFEIGGKSANKVKREIEKKNHFCLIE